MDGVVGTVKSMVYRRVLAGDIVIDNPKQFANFAQELCKVDLLLLTDESLRPSSYTELLRQRIKIRSSKKSKCELNSAQIRRLKPTRKTIFNSGTNSASLPHLNINFVLNSGWFQTPF